MANQPNGAGGVLGGDLGGQPDLAGVAVGLHIGGLVVFQPLEAAPAVVELLPRRLVALHRVACTRSFAQLPQGLRREHQPSCLTVPSSADDGLSIYGFSLSSFTALGETALSVG